jgi:hypothetical protein
VVDSTWLTPTAVRAWSGQRQGDAADTTALQLACNAAAEYVEAVRADLWTAGDPLADPPVLPEFTPGPRVTLGATMLAHRWYSRRASPLGVAGYAELGSSGILRYDPDIAKLLGLGSESGRFVFGAPDVPVPGV